MRRVDLHQYDVFGIVIGNDELPQQSPVGVVIETAQIESQLRREPVRLQVLVGGGRLVSVEGREGLQLDELWLKLAAWVAHQPKVYLDEHWQRRLIRDVVLGGDRRVGGAAVIGIVDEL